MTTAETTSSKTIEAAERIRTRVEAAREQALSPKVMGLFFDDDLEKFTDFLVMFNLRTAFRVANVLEKFPEDEDVQALAHEILATP